MKMKPKINIYEVLRKAVEDGVNLGCNRAYKHTNHPDKELLKERIIHSVMETISEVVHYE